MSRNAGFPLVRTIKNPGDHEITTPELRKLLLEREAAAKLRAIS